MPDLQSRGGNIVFLNDNGDSLYNIPLDLVTQLNKVPFGIGQTSLNENISLSGTDNSLLLGDSITVASGKTITLSDSSTLNVLSNADIQRATGIQQRTYEAGEIVQVKFKRIDDGIYGYCEETGEPIGIKRLEARPVATLSLEAQENHEKKEKKIN